MTELICIVCPKGCRLTVDEENDYLVTGNSCPRGEAYGKKELTAPTRTVTSTVAITGALHDRLPVKTAAEVPKNKVFDVVKALEKIAVSAPVRRGDVILTNAGDTGISVIATKDMPSV